MSDPDGKGRGVGFRLSSAVFLLNILVIFTLATGVRLAYWNDARAYSLGGDEPDYVVPAQTLVRDGRYVDTFIDPGRTWTRVPLTSLVFAGSFLFVPDKLAAQAAGDDAALMQPRYDALNLTQIGESLVTIALIMLLAARAFPQRPQFAAIIAGYIGALYPPLASSPAQRALSEPTVIMLAFAAIYVFSWWSPLASLRRNLLVAALGGGLLGAGALARPQALVFLPFAWIWLFIVIRAHRLSKIEAVPKQTVYSALRTPQLLLSALVSLVVALLAISPWTLYNYRHYGRFILLDTASATAYWNYHNFRREDITARMGALPNPADRLSLIVSEGTANLIEYPNQTVGSTLFAFLYMWHLESNSAVLIKPWDMSQRDPDVPDLLHSDAAFLLVSLAGVAGLAGVGLRGVRRPVDPGSCTLLLLDLWLLSAALLGLVVPYDARYRLPMSPALIVLAAGLVALANWRDLFLPRRAWAVLRSHRAVAVIALLLCIWVVAGAYSPKLPPLFRALYEGWRGDLALASGDNAAAFARYSLGEQADPDFYWPYRHAADIARQLGSDDEARTLYEAGWERNPDDPYGILGFADLVARHPEWKLTANERHWLDREESDWRGNPWNSFQPTARASIDVGTGSDIPYVRGFYRPDQPSPDFNYRWSMGRATIRIPVPPVGTYNSVILHLSAPAVSPGEPMLVSISVDGGSPTALTVPSGWQDYRVPLPPGDGAPGKTVLLDITSPVRVPSHLQPGSRDNRTLGVGIDRVTLTGP